MESKDKFRTFNPWTRAVNWLPLVLPILWYVVFKWDVAQGMSQTSLVIMYHDVFAKIIPSIGKLKMAENFNYSNALMYSTFWWFLPLLSKLSYSNIMFTIKHKESLFLEKSVFGKSLTIIGLLTIVFFTINFPIPIMHKGTDALYFNANYFEIFGLLGLSGGFTCFGLIIAYTKIVVCNWLKN